MVLGLALLGVTFLMVGLPADPLGFTAGERAPDTPTAGIRVMDGDRTPPWLGDHTLHLDRPPAPERGRRCTDMAGAAPGGCGAAAAEAPARPPPGAGRGIACRLRGRDRPGAPPGLCARVDGAERNTGPVVAGG